MKNHISILTAYKIFWKDYANFKGTNNRTIYWKTFMINWIIRIILALLIAISYLTENPVIMWISTIILGIYCLIALLPSLSMIARRYRDATINPKVMILTYFLPILLKFTTRYCPSSPNPLSLYLIGNLFSLLIFICLTLAIILPMFPSRE